MDVDVVLMAKTHSCRYVLRGRGSRRGITPENSLYRGVLLAPPPELQHGVYSSSSARHSSRIAAAVVNKTLSLYLLECTCTTEARGGGAAGEIIRRRPNLS